MGVYFIMFIAGMALILIGLRFWRKGAKELNRIDKEVELIDKELEEIQKDVKASMSKLYREGLDDSRSD